MYLGSNNSLKTFNSTQKSSFHTSVVANRYGRQNKSRPRVNFFRPNWRYLLNLQNLIHHKLDGDNQFNKVLPYFSLSNYPIGDGNIRRRKELVAPFDDVKTRYFELFPDERTTYLYDTDAGLEWYRPPVDRFISNMARRMAESVEKMTVDQAFELALQDKQWEEESRRIEFQVQKQQAEILFGYEEKDWLKEQTNGASRFEEDFDNDPREEEKADNIKEQKLITLVNQRIINPKRTKIKLSDTQMEFFEVVQWLSRNPQFKDYFHESIFWGDVPYHELFLEDAATIEATEADDANDEGKYLDPEIDPEQSLQSNSDKDKNKLKAAKRALENDTLLEDLNVSMGAWASDLLDYFADATERDDIYPEQRSHINAAVEARNQLIHEMKETSARILDEKLSQTDDIFPVPGSIFKDSVDEVMQDHNTKRPYVSASLEEELASLFRKVPKSE